MRSLTTVSNSNWRGLPKSSKAADQLGYTYYFSGEKCRNGHIALAKVHYGCVVCAGLARARADIRLNEEIARRELKKLGAVRRLATLSRAEGRVLGLIAERGGVFTQTELIDPSVRGMGKASVNRAVSSLIHQKLVAYDSRMYRVTLAGHAAAVRLGVNPAPYSPIRKTAV